MPLQQPPPSPPSFSSTAIAALVSVTSLASLVLGVGVTYGTQSGKIERTAVDLAAERVERQRDRDVLDAHLRDEIANKNNAIKIQAEQEGRIRALETTASELAKLGANVQIIGVKMDAVCRVTHAANCGP